MPPSADSDLTARLARSPKPKRRPRFGPILFVLTLIICVTVALGYRQIRTARDQDPMIQFADEFAQAIAGVGEDGVFDESSITTARESLGEIEVSVEDLAPYAVGGCRAAVLVPTARSTNGIIGNIYVRDTRGIYAIEFTAAQGEEGIGLTHVWKAQRVGGDPRVHARAAVDAMLEDGDSDLEGARIRDPKFFYYALESSD